MSEENKKLEGKDLEGVAGGWAGSDKYTFDQYALAGVAFEHNIWSKDRYLFRGVSINQKTAEAIGDFFAEYKRQPTDTEFNILKAANS